MNKYFKLIAALLIVAFLFGCGGSNNVVKEDPAPAKPAYPKVTTLKTQPGPVPNFFSKPQMYIEKDSNTGELMIYIWLSKEGEDLNATTRILEGEATARIAEGIKRLVSTQFSQAMSGDANASDEYFESSVAFVSKNVKVAGFMKISGWWRQIATQLEEGAETTTTYEVYGQWAMPYATYKKARDEAFQKQQSQVDPEMKEKVQSNLQDLDEAAELMEWSAEGF